MTEELRRDAAPVGRSAWYTARMNTPRHLVLSATALLCAALLSTPGCGDDGGTASGGDGVTSAGDSTAGADDAGGAADDSTAGPGDEVPLFDVAAVDFPYCAVDEAAMDALLASMSLEVQIGQHLMFGIGRSGDGVAADSVAMMETLMPGGVFVGLGGIAVADPLATARFLRDAQRRAIALTGAPMFISLDQEGGANSVVNSLTGGTDTIGSMPLGAVGDPQVAFEQFDIAGRELRATGFNMALAPVLDTLTSTRNGNLNTRSFGPDYALNAVLGTAAFAGLQHNLIMGVGKHFPGDGMSDGNPHTTEVTVEADRATLDATLLGPFATAVDNGLDGMMTMPARFSALDPDRSAIVSRKVTTGVLRGDLGFDGLIVTDSLGMEGAKTGLPAGQRPGTAAMLAGADVLLHVTISAEDADELVAQIKAALDDGSLDTAEFDTSTRRILRDKQRYCLFEDLGDGTAPVDEDALLAAIQRPEDDALSQAHADRAIVLLHDDGVLPLTGRSVAYAGPDTIFQDAGSGWLNAVDQTFGEALRQHDAAVTEVTWALTPAPASFYDSVLEHLATESPDVLVIGTIQGRFSLEQQQIVEWLLDAVDIPIVHVILGVPFDYFQTRDRVAAAVALMGSRSVMVEAAARVLYGEVTATGTMHYDLSAEADVVAGGPGDVSNVDRCADQAIACAGDGVCVDTGASFGCVCHPNWHPSDDGLDCVPDGS